MTYLATSLNRSLISQLATYLAFFSVTYLATSLKLAKFSVTERTAGTFVPMMELSFSGPGSGSGCIIGNRAIFVTKTKTITKMIAVHLLKLELKYSKKTKTTGI